MTHSQLKPERLGFSHEPTVILATTISMKFRKIILFFLIPFIFSCDEEVMPISTEIQENCSDCESLLGKTIIQSEHLLPFGPDTGFGCYVVDDFVLKSSGFIDAFRYGPGQIVPDTFRNIMTYSLSIDCELIVDLSSRTEEAFPHYPGCSRINTHFSPAGLFDSYWGRIYDISCDSITVAGLRFKLQ